MITALVSAVTGLVSGLAPDIFKEWRAQREHTRETEALEKQTDLQLKIANTNANIRMGELELEGEIAAAEGTAVIAKASLKDSGNKFANAWNAILRPFAVTIIILLFAVIAGFYAYYVLKEVQSLEDAQTAVQLLWGSLIGEAIQAVLGFLFGYRSTRR